jgi:hypothetical protein
LCAVVRIIGTVVRIIGTVVRIGTGTAVRILTRTGIVGRIIGTVGPRINAAVLHENLSDAWQFKPTAVAGGTTATSKQTCCKGGSARIPHRYHQYRDGGKLSDPLHYDAGSLITLDIMLSEPGKDFNGGELCTRELDERCVIVSIGLCHAFECGLHATSFDLFRTITFECPDGVQQHASVCARSSPLQ